MTPPPPQKKDNDDDNNFLTYTPEERKKVKFELCIVKVKKIYDKTGSVYHSVSKKNKTSNTIIF